MSDAAAAARALPRTWPERALAALPILTLFFWLWLFYAWQSWGHVTPWLFTDELENAQLSRAIAATGHAARRGTPHSFDTLYNFVLAPTWRIHNTHTAYTMTTRI